MAACCFLIAIDFRVFAIRRLLPLNFAVASIRWPQSGHYDTPIERKLASNCYPQPDLDQTTHLNKSIKQARPIYSAPYARTRTPAPRISKAFNPPLLKPSTPCVPQHLSPCPYPHAIPLLPPHHILNTSVIPTPPQSLMNNPIRSRIHSPHPTHLPLDPPRPNSERSSPTHTLSRLTLLFPRGNGLGSGSGV